MKVRFNLIYIRTLVTHNLNWQLHTIPGIKSVARHLRDCPPIPLLIVQVLGPVIPGRPAVSGYRSVIR